MYGSRHAQLVVGRSGHGSASRVFASYLLMPLPDYRQQVWRAVDLDVMRHCADRYGVSVTAAILKWLSYTEEKAIVVMSIDGYMKWSWSSTPAFKSGAFFRTRTSAGMDNAYSPHAGHSKYCKS
jgi:hypothetical protein